MAGDMDQQIIDHKRTIDALREQTPVLESIAARILTTIRNGGCIYLIGNGGSAADAQHIAAELLGRFKRDRRPLPAVALTTDTSTLTAIANDLGVESMFARQVEALATDCDLVWLLSVSGTSPNVVAAARAARSHGATVIGFTSRQGQALATLCDECLKIDADESDRVQEAHALAYHLICDHVERAFA